MIVADEYATRTEVNGFGTCLNRVKQEQAACKADKDVRLRRLEEWTGEQEGKIGNLQEANHKLELNMKDLGNDIVRKLSARNALFVGIATVVIAAIQIAAVLLK